MIVPQPTAQYGQVDRVSLARAIFRTRSCAYAGFKSKPNTAAAAPPMVVNFRKSRRVGFMLGPSSVRTKLKRVSRKLPNTTYLTLCQALTPFRCANQGANTFSWLLSRFGHARNRYLKPLLRDAPLVQQILKLWTAPQVGGRGYY